MRKVILPPAFPLPDFFLYLTPFPVLLLSSLLLHSCFPLVRPIFTPFFNRKPANFFLSPLLQIQPSFQLSGSPLLSSISTFSPRTGSFYHTHLKYGAKLRLPLNFLPLFLLFRSHNNRHLSTPTLSPTSTTPYNPIHTSFLISLGTKKTRRKKRREQ